MSEFKFPAINMFQSIQKTGSIGSKETQPIVRPIAKESNLFSSNKITSVAADIEDAKRFFPPSSPDGQGLSCMGNGDLTARRIYA